MSPVVSNKSHNTAAVRWGRGVYVSSVLTDPLHTPLVAHTSRDRYPLQVDARPKAANRPLPPRICVTYFGHILTIPSKPTSTPTPTPTPPPPPPTPLFCVPLWCVPL